MTKLLSNKLSFWTSVVRFDTSCAVRFRYERVRRNQYVTATVGNALKESTTDPYYTSPSFIWMRKLGAILERHYANAGVVVRMHRNEFFRSLASMIRYAGANESREFMNKWSWCDRRSTQPVERQMSLGHRRLDVCVGEGSQPSATNSKHDHRSAVVKTQSQIVPVRIVRVGSKLYWLLRSTVLQQRGNFINNGLLYGRHLTTSLATTFHDAF